MYHLKLDNLIYDCENIVEYDSFTFSGGEEHIRIKTPKDKMLNSSIMIETSLTSSLKVMQLLLATDALKRLGIKDISLFSPYFPYGRQDRVCNIGESLSLKVMADIINIQQYKNVYILDAHSDVTLALVDNYKSIDSFYLVCRAFGISCLGQNNSYLISPDAGALKKTYALAKRIGGWVNVLTCNKNRNVSSGEIESLTIDAPDLKGKTCYIIDDICDGGRTFIEIAKKLRSKNCDDIKLFISHGIFSKGISVFDGLIDEVTTTNSIDNGIIPTSMKDIIQNKQKNIWAINFKKEDLND